MDGKWWVVGTSGGASGCLRASTAAGAAALAAEWGAGRAVSCRPAGSLSEALVWLDARRPEEGWEGEDQDGDFTPRKGLDGGADPSPHAAPGEYHLARAAATRKGRRGGGRGSSMMAHPSVLGGAEPMGFDSPEGSGAAPMGRARPGDGPL